MLVQSRSPRPVSGVTAIRVTKTLYVKFRQQGYVAGHLLQYSISVWPILVKFDTLNYMKTYTTMAFVVAALIFGFVSGHLFTSVLLPTPLALAPNNKSELLDTSMSNMMHDMSASLEGKSGEDFDKQFLSDMIVHHQGAVDMARKALVSAGDPRIKELSTAIISAQEKEIADMKSWQKPMSHDMIGH
jgi:hypothetical protein